MTIRRLVPNAHHISEFHNGYHGTCTQTSAAMCLASALGTPTDHDGVVNLMLAMTHSMQQHGTASSNGAATVAGMAEEVRQRGGQLLVEWDYEEPLSQDWHSLVRDHAGIHPILLQVANAQGLYDAGGQAEDQGVHYHAIAIMGLADNGYVVGDPNNAAVEQAFDVYSYAALLNARPCGLMMLDAKGSVHAMPIPTGWNDDGTTLTATNGKTLVHGFRGVVLAAPGWAADDVPLEEERGFAANVARQITDCHVLHWDGQQAWAAPAGPEFLAAEAALYEERIKTSALSAQLAAAQAQPAPSDSHAQKALAALAALKDAINS